MKEEATTGRSTTITTILRTFSVSFGTRVLRSVIIPLIMSVRRSSHQKELVINVTDELFPSDNIILQLIGFRRRNKNGLVISNQHAAIKPTTTGTSNGEKRIDTMVQFQHHEPTALTREDNEAWGPREYHYQNHPLHLMVLYLTLGDFHFYM